MKSGDDGYRFDEYLILYKDINLDYYSGYNVIDALNSYCKEHPYLELSQWIGNSEKKEHCQVYDQRERDHEHKLVRNPHAQS